MKEAFVSLMIGLFVYRAVELCGVQSPTWAVLIGFAASCVVYGLAANPGITYHANK